jgi:hypothetical protein
MKIKRKFKKKKKESRCLMVWIERKKKTETNLLCALYNAALPT